MVEGVIDKLVYRLGAMGFGVLSTGIWLWKGSDDDFRIGFYNHKETPGLGGEVDNSKWKASWKGVRLYDLGRNPSVALVKTRSIQIRKMRSMKWMLSGATFTTRGVENLVNFWTGELGFGNFIERLRASRELAQR